MAGEGDIAVIKNFGKDTLLYVPYRIFPVLFGFVGLWVYTRIFTLEDFGQYSLLTITMGLLGILAYTWINESNMRLYLPYKNENRLQTYFTTSFVLQSLTLVVIVILLVALWCLSLLPGVMINYFALFAVALASFSFYETCLTILRSERMVSETSLFRTVSTLLYLVISLLLIFYFQMGIASVLLGYIATNVVLTVILMWRHGYLGHLRIERFSLATMREFISYGLPLMATQIFYWALVLSDRYIIEFFCGSRDVGIYTAAYQLADYPISMFLSMMLIASVPIILDTWDKKGEEPTKVLITSLMRYYLLFVIPAFVGVTLLAQNMMVILTRDYFAGYVIIPFICLAKAQYGLVWYLNKGMELKKKTFVLAVLISIAAVVDIALNLTLVPALGFVGASVSLAISFTVYSLLSLVFSRRYLRWPMPWGSMKNIVLATGVMAVVVIIAQQYLALSILSLLALVGLGLTTYLVVILLSGEVNAESRYLAKALQPAVMKAAKRIYRSLPYSALISHAIYHR